MHAPEKLQSVRKSIQQLATNLKIKKAVKPKGDKIQNFTVSSFC